jgi:hypothetical protein
MCRKVLERRKYSVTAKSAGFAMYSTLPSSDRFPVLLRVGLKFCYAGLLAGISAIAAATEEAEHIYYSLVPGHYVVIGRHPDAGKTYSGTASISYEHGHLLLSKKLGEDTVSATGVVGKASPGEADLIRFEWEDHSETCLLAVDLDNYSRLTCYWTVNGAKHREPGLEAYFSTDAWHNSLKPE